MKHLFRTGLLFILALTALSGAAAQQPSMAAHAMPAAAPYPVGNILDHIPEFVVAHAEGNEWYQLRIVVEGVQIHEQWHDAQFCDPFSMCTLHPEVTLAQTLGHNEGTWQSRPWGEADGIGQWSELHAFTLLAPNITDVTQTDTPGPNYIVQYLADENGERPNLYRLVVVGDNGVEVDIWTPPISCGGATCSLYPYVNPHLENGNYTVYVRAFTNGVGLSAWSGARNFTINTAPPQMPEDVAINNVFMNGNPENACFPSASVQGNLCVSPTLSFRVDYTTSQAEWMHLSIEELLGDVVYQTWIQVDGNPFCIFEGYCTIQVPVVFEEGTTYTWRARIWNPHGGMSQFTVPGGGASGDPNNVGIFTVENMLAAVRTDQ